MRLRPVAVLATALLIAVVRAVPVPAAEREAPRMTKEELQGLLGSPDVVILDVRLGGEQATSRIPGAVYEDPGDVGTWAGRYPKEKTLVLYCS